jgi:hypothetical protein
MLRPPFNGQRRKECLVPFPLSVLSLKYRGKGGKKKPRFQQQKPGFVPRNIYPCIDKIHIAVLCVLCAFVFFVANPRYNGQRRAGREFHSIDPLGKMTRPYHSLKISPFFVCFVPLW